DYDAELILSDLQVAEKRLHRLKQERNTGGEFQELQRLAKHLESGAPLRLLGFSDAEDQVLAHFGFLSRKPMLVVANVAEEDAARAWTIKRGDGAARAAGKIHSDLEKSFVRAEVMHYDDFLAAGNEHRARELGKLRLEGKDYAVHDGDILTVRAGRAK